MDQDKQDPTQSTGGLEADSLEGSSTVVSSNTPQNTESSNPSQATPSAATAAPQLKGFAAFAQRINIYLLLFIFIIIITAGVIGFAILKQRKVNTPQNNTSQSISSQSLGQISESNTTIGGPKQTLAIQSPTTFGQAVTIKNNLQVTGTLEVGGNITLPSLNVPGTSNFNTIQTTGLTDSGTATFDGQVTAQSGLNVNGPVNFNGALSVGTLSIATLTLNNDLTITHHLLSGGNQAGFTKGSALGNGGTSSLSGNDNAGTINVNIGAGAPVSGGCFGTVTFAKAYGSTPHVMITPVGVGSANMFFYVTESTSSFSVCASNFVSSVSFALNYFVIN